MIAPRIGALRTRVALEAPVETADDIGGVARGWAVAAMLWARVETLGGGEAEDAGGLVQTLRHRVTLRWRADVTAAARLRIGARIFDVRTARDPDGRRRVLICECEERAP